VLAGAFGVRETVFQRMLCREKRRDTRPWDILAEIGHEVAQVIFFLCTDGAVSEKHERVLPRQAPDRVVRVESTRPCPRRWRAQRAGVAVLLRTPTDQTGAR